MFNKGANNFQRGLSLSTVLMVLSIVCVITVAMFIYTYAPGSSGFRAFHIKGIAPFTVVFASSYGLPKYTQDTSYFIDFGDGTTESGACGFNYDGNRCYFPILTRHTYAQPGVYVASLKMGSMCPKSGGCFSTIASSTITIIR